MKKILSLLIVLSMVLTCSLSTIVYGAEETILFHSFSDGMGNFKSSSTKTGDKITITKDPASGKNVLKILDDSDSLAVGIKSPRIDIKEECAYTVVVNMKVLSGTIKLYVKFFDADSKQVDSKSLASKVGEYNLVTVALTAPAGAETIEISVATVSTTLGEGYVDSIKIIEGDKIKTSETVRKVKESTDQNVRRFSVKDGTENYTIKGIETGVEIKDGYMCSSAIPTSYLEITPEEPIKVDNLNMKIKYKLKAISSSKINYLGLHFYGNEGKQGTSLYVVSFPTSDKWYEGEIELMDAGQIGSRGAFEPGDTIENFRIALGNNSGKNVEGVFEYVEFVAGQEDMWGAPKGQDIIDEVAKKVAEAKPGDTIIIPDGIYTGVKMEFEGQGEEGKPVTIKAQTPGKVIINGLSTMTVDGKYVTVDGLWFKEAWNPSIITYKPSSSYCRLTNTAMISCNNPNRSTKAVWITVGGQYNQIDHCFFNHKINHGVLFSMARNSDPNYFTINNNYFGNFEPSVVGNGAETLRAGSGAASYVPSKSVIENNFFEACDGEGELISLKAADTIVRYNTLYNSAGGLCLRAGDNNEVYGNVFYKTTGVRVIGINQVVRDNYIAQSVDTSIAVESGTDPNDAQYTPVKNAKITNNTIDGSVKASMINVGETAPGVTNVAYPRKYKPEGIYENNLVVAYYDNQIELKGELPEFKISNNAQVGIYESKIKGFENISSVSKNEKGFFYTDGYGANIEEINKAPLDPREILTGWILEKVNNNEEGFKIGKVELSSGNKDEIGIFINEKRLISDVAPVEMNGRTLVPLRAIFEAMDATVSWDEATSTATAQRGDLKIALTENNTTAYVNDNPYTLDVPATILSGRFVVPVRFISETLGAKVEWVEGTKTVIISGGTVKYPVKSDIENAVPVFDAIQSGDDGTGKTIANVLDGNISSKWGVLHDPANYESAYGIFDLGSSIDIDSAWISFSAGNAREYTIDIYVSDDNVNYTLVKEGYKSSGKTLDFEQFPINKKGRFIKIYGRGNSVNQWLNLQEVAITKK